VPHKVMKNMMFKRITAFLTLSTFLTTNLAWGASFPSSGEASSLVIEVPSELGTVRRLFLNSAAGEELPKRFVFYIHDAHADLQAQKNIQELVAYFQKKFAVSSILAEGASGEADLSGFRNFPDKNLTTEVADQFLKTAEITGFEYAAITSKASLRLIGLEDQAVYEKHVKAYSENQNVLEQNRKIISNQIQKITEEKKSIYNKRLYEFDQILSRSDSLVQFNRIIPYLARRARELGINFDRLDSIRTFLRMQVIEGILNLPWQMPEKADRDRYVKRLNELQETLKPDVLSRQTEELKTLVKENLFRNTKERDLNRRADFLEMVSRLIDLKLSPEDWEKYKVRSRGVSPRIAGQDARPTRSGARNDGPQLQLSSAEKFYRLALERDKALAKNLLRELEHTNRAFLITGGFHGPALENALEEAGISFVSIYPGVSESPDLRHYAERMSGDMKTLAAAPTMAPLMFSEHTLMPRLLTFEPAFQKQFIAIRENRYRSSAVRLNQTGLKLAGFGNSFGATSFTVEVKDRFGRDDITLDQPLDPFSYRWVYLKKVIAHDDPDFLLHSLRRAASNEALVIEDVMHIAMRRIQYGMYHDVFRVEVTVKGSTEPVVFAILLTQNPNANKATVDDYENLTRLRSRFPAFAHYLQDPIALHDADEIEGYSMYSAVWIDDYYEIDTYTGDRPHTLQINDFRAVNDRGESVYSPSVVVEKGILTPHWTRDLIRSVFRLLTIFYDEETGEAIRPNSIYLGSGDIMAHKSFTDPRDVRLVTVRQIGKFTVREFLDAMVSQEVPSGINAGFNMHLGESFARERAMGIIDGLVEKYGRDKGLVVARRWALEPSRFSPVLTEALASTGFGTDYDEPVQSPRQGFGTAPADRRGGGARRTRSEEQLRAMTDRELLKNIRWWKHPSRVHLGRMKRSELAFLFPFIRDDMNLFWAVAKNKGGEIPVETMEAFRWFYGLEDGIAHSREETARLMGKGMLPHTARRRAHAGLFLLFLVATGGPIPAYEVLMGIPEHKRPHLFRRMLPLLGRLQRKAAHLEAVKINRPQSRAQMDERVNRIARELPKRIRMLAGQKLEGGFKELISRLKTKGLVTGPYFGERFQKSPHIRIIRAVASELKVSIDQLLGTEDFRIKHSALETGLREKSNAAARIDFLDRYHDLSYKERETLVQGAASMKERFRRKRAEFIRVTALLRMAFLNGISPGQLIGSVETGDYEPGPPKPRSFISANGMQIELIHPSSRAGEDLATVEDLKAGSTVKLRKRFGNSLILLPADLLQASSIKISAKSDGGKEELTLDLEVVTQMLGRDERNQLEISWFLVISPNGAVERSRTDTLRPSGRPWQGEPDLPLTLFELHWQPDTFNLTIEPLSDTAEVEVRAQFLKRQIPHARPPSFSREKPVREGPFSRVSVVEATSLFLRTPTVSDASGSGFGSNQEPESLSVAQIEELRRYLVQMGTWEDWREQFLLLREFISSGVHGRLFDELPSTVSRSDARGFISKYIPADKDRVLPGGLESYLFFPMLPERALVEWDYQSLVSPHAHLSDALINILGLDYFRDRKPVEIHVDPDKLIAVRMKNARHAGKVVEIIDSVMSETETKWREEEQRVWEAKKDTVRNELVHLYRTNRNLFNEFRSVFNRGVHPAISGETGIGSVEEMMKIVSPADRGKFSPALKRYYGVRRAIEGYFLQHIVLPKRYVNARGKAQGDYSPALFPASVRAILGLNATKDRWFDVKLENNLFGLPAKVAVIQFPANVRRLAGLFNTIEQEFSQGYQERMPPEARALLRSALTAMAKEKDDENDLDHLEQLIAYGVHFEIQRQFPENVYSSKEMGDRGAREYLFDQMDPKDRTVTFGLDSSLLNEELAARMQTFLFFPTLSGQHTATVEDFIRKLTSDASLAQQVMDALGIDLINRHPAGVDISTIKEASIRGVFLRQKIKRQKIKTTFKLTVVGVKMHKPQFLSDVLRVIGESRKELAEQKEAEERNLWNLHEDKIREVLEEFYNSNSNIIDDVYETLRRGIHPRLYRDFGIGDGRQMLDAMAGADRHLFDDDDPEMSHYLFFPPFVVPPRAPPREYYDFFDKSLREALGMKSDGKHRFSVTLISPSNQRTVRVEVLWVEHLDNRDRLTDLFRKIAYGFGAAGAWKDGSIKHLTPRQLLNRIHWYPEKRGRRTTDGDSKKDTLQFVLNYFNGRMNEFWNFLENKDNGIPKDSMLSFSLYFGLVDGETHPVEEIAGILLRDGIRDQKLERSGIRKRKIPFVIRKLFVAALGSHERAFEELTRLSAEGIEFPQELKPLFEDLKTGQAVVKAALGLKRPKNRAEMDKRIETILEAFPSRLREFVSQQPGGRMKFTGRLRKKELIAAPDQYLSESALIPGLPIVMTFAREMGLSIDRLLGTESFRVRSPSLVGVLRSKKAAERIKYLGEISGLNRRQRADLGGLHVDALVRFENSGDSARSLETFLRISFVYGVSPGQLMGSVVTGDFEPKPGPMRHVFRANGIEVNYGVNNMSNGLANEHALATIQLQPGRPIAFNALPEKAITFSAKQLTRFSRIIVERKLGVVVERLTFEIDTAAYVADRTRFERIGISGETSLPAGGRGKSRWGEDLLPGSEPWKGHPFKAIEVHWSNKDLSLTIKQLDASENIFFSVELLDDAGARAPKQTPRGFGTSGEPPPVPQEKPLPELDEHIGVAVSPDVFLLRPEILKARALLGNMMAASMENVFDKPEELTRYVREQLPTFKSVDGGAEPKGISEERNILFLATLVFEISLETNLDSALWYYEHLDLLKKSISEIFQAGHVFLSIEKSRDWPEDEIRSTIAHEYFHLRHDEFVRQKSPDEKKAYKETARSFLTSQKDLVDFVLGKTSPDGVLYQQLVGSGYAMIAYSEFLAQLAFPSHEFLRDVSPDGTILVPEGLDEMKRKYVDTFLAGRNSFLDLKRFKIIFDLALAEANELTPKVMDAFDRLDKTRGFGAASPSEELSSKRSAKSGAEENPTDQGEPDREHVFRPLVSDNMTTEGNAINDAGGNVASDSAEFTQAAELYNNVLLAFFKEVILGESKDEDPPRFDWEYQADFAGQLLMHPDLFEQARNFLEYLLEKAFDLSDFYYYVKEYVVHDIVSAMGKHPKLRERAYEIVQDLRSYTKYTSDEGYLILALLQAIGNDAPDLSSRLLDDYEKVIESYNKREKDKYEPKDLYVRKVRPLARFGKIRPKLKKVIDRVFEDEARITAWIDLAQGYFNDSEYEASFQVLVDASKLPRGDGAFPRLRDLLAKFVMVSGFRTRVFDLIETWPNERKWQTHVAIGHVFYRNRFRAEAEKHYKKALSISSLLPEHSDHVDFTFVRLAFEIKMPLIDDIEARLQGMYEKAKEILAEIDPKENLRIGDIPEEVQNAAYSLMVAGNYTQAEEIVQLIAGKIVVWGGTSTVRDEMYHILMKAAAHRVDVAEVTRLANVMRYNAQKALANAAYILAWHGEYQSGLLSAVLSPAAIDRETEEYVKGRQGQVISVDRGEALLEIGSVLIEHGQDPAVAGKVFLKAAEAGLNREKLSELIHEIRKNPPSRPFLIPVLEAAFKHQVATTAVEHHLPYAVILSALREFFPSLTAAGLGISPADLIPTKRLESGKKLTQDERTSRENSESGFGAKEDEGEFESVESMIKFFESFNAGDYVDLLFSAATLKDSAQTGIDVRPRKPDPARDAERQRLQNVILAYEAKHSFRPTDDVFGSLWYVIESWWSRIHRLAHSSRKRALVKIFSERLGEAVKEIDQPANEISKYTGFEERFKALLIRAQAASDEYQAFKMGRFMVRDPAELISALWQASTKEGMTAKEDSVLGPLGLDFALAGTKVYDFFVRTFGRASGESMERWTNVDVARELTAEFGQAEQEVAHRVVPVILNVLAAAELIPPNMAFPKAGFGVASPSEEPLMMGEEQLSDGGVSSTTQRGKPHPRLPMFQKRYKSGIPYQSPFGGLGGIKTHPAINIENTNNPSTTLMGAEVSLNQREAAPDPESTMNKVSSVEPTFSRLKGSSIAKVPFDLEGNLIEGGVSLSRDSQIVNKQITKSQLPTGFGAVNWDETSLRKWFIEHVPDGAELVEKDTFRERALQIIAALNEFPAGTKINKRTKDITPHFEALGISKPGKLISDLLKSEPPIQIDPRIAIPILEVPIFLIPEEVGLILKFFNLKNIPDKLSDESGQEYFKRIFLEVKNLEIEAGGNFLSGDLPPEVLYELLLGSAEALKSKNLDWYRSNKSTIIGQFTRVFQKGNILVRLDVRLMSRADHIRMVLAHELFHLNLEKHIGQLKDKERRSLFSHVVSLLQPMQSQVDDLLSNLGYSKLAKPDASLMGKFGEFATQTFFPSLMDGIDALGNPIFISEEQDPAERAKLERRAVRHRETLAAVFKRMPFMKGIYRQSLHQANDYLIKVNKVLGGLSSGFGATSIIIPDAEDAIRNGEITAEALLKTAKENPRTRIHFIFSEMETWEHAAEFIESAFGAKAKEIFPLVSIHTAETIRARSKLSLSANPERLRRAILDRLTAQAKGQLVVVESMETAGTDEFSRHRGNVRRLLIESKSGKSHPNLLSKAIILSRWNGAERIDELVERGLKRLDGNRWLDIETDQVTQEIFDQIMRARNFDIAA